MSEHVCTHTLGDGPRKPASTAPQPPPRNRIDTPRPRRERRLDEHAPPLPPLFPPGPRPRRDDRQWDLWQGVCAERPFIGKEWYHPGNWRKRLDFGTGTFGDMGCHIYDPVFAALALTGALSERPGYTKTSSSSRTCSSSSSSVCSGAKRSALKPRSMPWSLMLPMISMR